MALALLVFNVERLASVSSTFSYKPLSDILHNVLIIRICRDYRVIDSKLRRKLNCLSYTFFYASILP